MYSRFCAAFRHEFLITAKYEHTHTHRKRKKATTNPYMEKVVLAFQLQFITVCNINRIK